MPERGAASLENCLERWLTKDEVQDWTYTNCSQRWSAVKKLVVEVVPELLIIQLERFRNAENSVEKTYKRVKFQWQEIGDRKYELKRVTYNSGSPMSDHYAAAVKFKQTWWNCNYAVAESMEEGKVVSETAYILFYKQMW